MDQTLTLGSVHVTRVLEYAGPTRPPAAMFPGLDRNTWQAHASGLAPDFWDPATDLLRTCVQTWVLRVGGETILVDTGVGNHKPRPAMPAFDRLDTDFPARLAAAGVTPAEVTTVVLTHLHADHVGWNTVLTGGEWVPTFPNATYLLARDDFEYWRPGSGHRPRMAEANAGVFEDSVLPVERAGLLRLWSEDLDLGHGLRLEAAPGHTPGSAVLTLASGGEHAMFVGDLLHNPVQFAEPDLNSCFCEDPATARTTRRRLLGRAADRHALRVPPGERRALVTPLHPTRRGDRTAARVTVRAAGPLGLAARQGSHAVPWTVRVLPPFHSRKHLPSRLARLQQLDGRNAVLIRGQGTEFDSLREYVIGDDVRSIDWRATARASDVMVRTWRPERDRHVVLVLDTGRVSAGRVGDAPRLDAAMDAALLLAALAARAGDRVDFFAYDRRLRAAAPGSSVPSLVNAMAPLEPSLVETDARGMVAEVLRRTRRRALVVLLTGLEEAPLEEGLFPVLGSLTTRHELVLASVADPRVAEMRAGRGDAESVYDAASAERTTAERRRVTDRLTRYGVHVVDAPPADLPPALADRYLALKAAGKL